MSGNVWEWCQDWYGEDYYKVSPESDPKGLKRAPTACCAAAAGAATLSSAGRPRASAAGPAAATAIWASASPGPLPLALEPLYPWQSFFPKAEGRERIAAEAKPAAYERTEWSNTLACFK